MPFQIIRADITKVECAAIVNAANSSLLGGGGVDGAIHAAAGPELLAECQALNGCKAGQAKLTRGYRLPAKYVIHTVGPVWRGGCHHERKLLASCYRESLELALETKCESVAFPLISAGAYGYPRDEALEVAVTEISRFLLEHEMLVYLVVYDRDSFQMSKKLLTDVAEYINERYVVEHPAERTRPLRLEELPEGTSAYTDILYDAAPSPSAFAPAAPAPAKLDALVAQVDESFSQMLLRKIDEKGWTDAQCYKQANLDRKLFSKIRNDIHYRPSKPTALAFAVALELSLDETRELLMKAGYALSHSSKFDIIIEYFIQRGDYDIFQINEALFAFDQSLLGG